MLIYRSPSGICIVVLKLTVFFINYYKVNESAVTGNVDNLEGGLDGVVQAVVCGDQVGWALQARKLMLVVTDGLLHFAGEGKVRINYILDNNFFFFFSSLFDRYVFYSKIINHQLYS